MKQHLDQCRGKKLSSEYWTAPGLHDSLRLSLSSDFLGALQQSVVDVFGAGNLRLDHAEVLGVRHGLCLHRVWLCGCRDQVG